MGDNVTRLPVMPRPRKQMLERVYPLAGECRHLDVTYRYTEDRRDVECGGCGAKLNPIWVISQLGNKESQWLRSFEAYVKMRKEHEARVRCKCEHCGKMTRIRGM